ncbi:MAG: hypothetical protein ACE5KP_01645 [Dehalococcoidales bacterium]
MRRAIADRLMDLCEFSAQQIAERWYNNVSTNPRTRSYHTISKRRAIRQAITIYRNLKRAYFAEKPYQEILNLLRGRQYVELLYDDEIPLHEAIYAIMLMRRHIWLFSELEALYSDTATDMYQALQSVNRVVLLFDYIIYSVTELYQELAEPES